MNKKKTARFFICKLEHPSFRRGFGRNPEMRPIKWIPANDMPE